VAKLAVELAKPRPGNDATGVFVVAPGEEETFMRRFHVADIPGVGPRSRERLDRLGLRTIPDVLERPLDDLVRLLGEREGRWLYERARGLGSAQVTGREDPRSISREETFGADLTDQDEIEGELLRLVTRAAADLRARELATRTVSVKLRDKDFRTRRASQTLDDPVVADRVIFETARELLRKLRRARRVPVRLLGVALTSLGARDEPRQMPLFDEPAADAESSRDRTLADTIDELRARFGRDAVVPARLATPRADGRTGKPRRGRAR
jgi:DNA polymerase-4